MSTHKSSDYKLTAVKYFLDHILILKKVLRNKIHR